MVTTCRVGGQNGLRVYIIEVISNNDSFQRKISQEGYTTLAAAQKWCQSRPGVVGEKDNGYDNPWIFRSEDYTYRIHDVIIK